VAAHVAIGETRGHGVPPRAGRRAGRGTQPGRTGDSASITAPPGGLAVRGEDLRSAAESRRAICRERHLELARRRRAASRPAAPSRRGVVLGDLIGKVPSSASRVAARAREPSRDRRRPGVWRPSHNPRAPGSSLIARRRSASDAVRTSPAASAYVEAAPERTSWLQREELVERTTRFIGAAPSGGGACERDDRGPVPAAARARRGLLRSANPARRAPAARQVHLGELGRLVPRVRGNRFEERAAASRLGRRRCRHRRRRRRGPVRAVFTRGDCCGERGAPRPPKPDLMRAGPPLTGSRGRRTGTRSGTCFASTSRRDMPSDKSPSRMSITSSVSLRPFSAAGSVGTVGRTRTSGRRAFASSLASRSEPRVPPQVADDLGVPLGTSSFGAVC
jgi:hypothetical protein